MAVANKNESFQRMLLDILNDPLFKDKVEDFGKGFEKSGQRSSTFQNEFVDFTSQKDELIKTVDIIRNNLDRKHSTKINEHDESAINLKSILLSMKSQGADMPALVKELLNPSTSDGAVPISTEILSGESLNNNHGELGSATGEKTNDENTYDYSNARSHGYLDGIPDGKADSSDRDCEEKLENMESASATGMAELQLQLKKVKQDLAQERTKCKVEREEKEKLQLHIDQQNVEIKELKSQVRQRDEEIKRLTNVIAKEWSKKVGANELDLENINVKDRPMTIAAEYENVRTQEWLDVKNELDEFTERSERDKHMFLCDMFMVAQRLAKIAYIKQITNIYSKLQEKESLDDVIIKSTIIHSVTSFSQLAVDFDEASEMEIIETEFGKIPTEIKDEIWNLFRFKSSEMDISNIIKAIIEDLGNKETYMMFKHIMSGKSGEKTTKYKKTQVFISACASLAWKMTLQRPPLTFDNEKGLGEKWAGEHMQIPYFNGDDPSDPDSVVQYYVHPTLIHGDKIMVKPTVFIAKEL